MTLPNDNMHGYVLHHQVKTPTHHQLLESTANAGASFQIHRRARRKKRHLSLSTSLYPLLNRLMARKQNAEMRGVGIDGLKDLGCTIEFGDKKGSDSKP